MVAAGATAGFVAYSQVLYELLTHELPFAGSTGVFAAASAAINGARPMLPGGTPQPIADMCRRCWRAEPAERPRFSTLGKELAAVRAALSEDALAWLDEPKGHSGTTAQPREGEVAGVACD